MKQIIYDAVTKEETIIDVPDINILAQGATIPTLEEIAEGLTETMAAVMELSLE
jgi:hypothetical protein